jgi:hypothetical protein
MRKVAYTLPKAGIASIGVESAPVYLSLILEGQGHSGAVSDDFAVFDFHVELADFGNAQVAQRPGGGLHRALRRVLPGYFAAADYLDYLVNSFGLDLPGHGSSPLRSGCK